MYYFVLAVCFCSAFAVIVRTINSPFGQVLKAIRENEPRAPSRSATAPSITNCLPSSCRRHWPGWAGSTKALVFQFASLTDVNWPMSGEVVLMTLIGGIGTILGPVVGAFLLTTMENYLAQAGSWVTIIEGLIFVICVLTFREGIVGVIAPYAMGWRARSEPLPDEAELRRKRRPRKSAKVAGEG